MKITEINIYPVKSLRGIGVGEARVTKRGFESDRRWMITDIESKFLTQRELPKMASISAALEPDGLRFSAPGTEDLTVAARPDKGESGQVQVWTSVCAAEFYDETVNVWFSELLGTKCRLVYMPEETKRGVNPLFNTGEDIVSFADGYPFMALGEASLADLNSRLEAPLPMNRFRPNLVISGAGAYAEDGWKRVRIGDTIFRATKPCARCTITTVDQAKGLFAGKEPLRTLAGYRKAKQVMPDAYAAMGMGANDVLFGRNLVPENVGEMIRVNDTVEVIEL
jgi:uncharacterized protein YcbX